MILRLLTSLILLSSYAHAACSLGGVIGGDFLSYNNLIEKFSIQYKSNWSCVDLDRTVNFFQDSPDSTASEIPSLSLNSKASAEIQSEADLLEWIRFFHPTESWRRVELAGRPSFETEAQGAGIVYVFRRPGHILSIRFDSAEKPEALHHIRQMLSTLAVF